MTAEAVVRARPAPISPAGGISGLIATEDLKEVLVRLFPCWEILKLSRAIHALRLWGPDAVFDVERYPVPFHSRVFTGRELLAMFLDHRRFVKDAMTAEVPLLTATEDGVVVEVNSVGMVGGLAHTDKLLRVCGELGIPRDTFIRTSNAESSVGGIVMGSMATFDPGQEIEWTIEGLARYLAPSRGWTNRFGERYTFTQAAENMIARDRGSGACLGTHVPYVLTVLLRLDENERFLNGTCRDRTMLYLRRVSRLLEERQSPDGTWPTRWAPELLGRDIQDSEEARTVGGLTLMGHHMEWIAIAPQEARPNARCVARALDFLVENTPKLSDTAVHGYYHLITDIGRALCHFAGVEVTNACKLLL